MLAGKQAKLEQGGKVVDGENLRHFCKICGCHLWAWAPVYAEFCYPVASAIDTAMPTPPERCVAACAQTGFCCVRLL